MILDIKAALAAAESRIGFPYLFGSKWPLVAAPIGPVDCSGFSRWVYWSGGVLIPEGSDNQFHASDPLPHGVLGALGFFKKPGQPCHHVGVLLNADTVIEARGEPYMAVIHRPRAKWEAWPEFTGWRWPKAAGPVVG